jgi:acyl-CoA synthetase (AMP-forming)/AMP-acid ligase II
MLDWWEKPAIKWSSNLCSLEPLYWNIYSEKEDLENRNSEISYSQLLCLTHLLATRLSRSHNNDSNEYVVVAIPEGPFLPIAILAVHICPTAVLVPIEPNDAMERIQHMIRNSKPSKILCLTGNDSDKIMQALSSTDFHSEIIDFRTLFLDCKKELDNLDLQFPSKIGASIWEILNVNNVHPGKLSHIVYTSGTTGIPKGCRSSHAALRHYLSVKNEAHRIGHDSCVLLASALSFDPCLSDILATFQAKATLVVTSRIGLQQKIASVMKEGAVTHVLCTPTLWSMVDSTQDIPTLQVVALGGEPIPKRIIQTWAHRVCLYSTYGVTEACVYQTMGPVIPTGALSTTLPRGHDVGTPFRGLQFKIVMENDNRELKLLDDRQIGEIVLSGILLDFISGYHNQIDLTAEKFICCGAQYFFKTGDRGYTINERLYLCGRIQNDGMVKVNGIRVELGEIEAALIDNNLEPDEPAVVEFCLAVAKPTDHTDDTSGKQIIAYCVLNLTCRSEMGISFHNDSHGILISQGSLLVLFRKLCKEKVRAGAAPNAFVVIPKIPTSPTGKADRRQLPDLSVCTSWDETESAHLVLLSDYGNSGAMVANVIIKMLNLQSCQQAMLTKTANFAMLGGDSLAATRIVRALYAEHHMVFDSRFLGGPLGELDGVFSVVNLLTSHTLGDYVDFLDSHGVGRKVNPRIDINASAANHESKINTSHHVKEEYEALLECIAKGRTSIAVGLLNAGVNPNACNHGGRLAKVSSRNERKSLFTSNPLHIACTNGIPLLVRKLLRKGCKFNSPDASGMFPLHLAAASTSGMKVYDHAHDEDLNRLECVRYLLNEGTPLSMKDGNKQTVLHAASRAGHRNLLNYVVQEWKQGIQDGRIKFYDTSIKGGALDWLDKWYRSPVHWAVLNGRVEALSILLQEGFSPNPPHPSNKSAKRGTSIKVESPLEICERVYTHDDPIGLKIKNLLLSRQRDDHR